MAAPIAGLDTLPTLETQAQRICLALQERELAMPIETRLNNVGVTYDFEASTASFTVASLPITIAALPTGKLEITPGIYPALP